MYEHRGANVEQVENVYEQFLSNVYWMWRILTELKIDDANEITTKIIID